ncbi:hypothetical protein I317_06688 [Kwoniella heveanensis CBS 569]|nr:hypothetical protein I317_06688 [Kwoniella heveanensis CBS 569]
MFNSKKRPTTASSSSPNKPFNPAHTHPASISSTPSNQSRVHVSSASGGNATKTASSKSSSVPVEGVQSGGGGGGGAGAGSMEGIDGEGIDKAKGGTQKGGTEQDANAKADAKWSDPKIVHPAWEGFGKGLGGGASQKDEDPQKGKGPKAKL